MTPNGESQEEELSSGHRLTWAPGDLFWPPRWRDPASNPWSRGRGEVWSWRDLGLRDMVKLDWCRRRRTIAAKIDVTSEHEWIALIGKTVSTYGRRHTLAYGLADQKAFGLPVGLGQPR